MLHRLYVLIPCAVAALLAWIFLPGSAVDRALFSLTARSFANPPFFITGNGTHTRPHTLRTLIGVSPRIPHSHRSCFLGDRSIRFKNRHWGQSSHPASHWGQSSHPAFSFIGVSPRIPHSHRSCFFGVRSIRFKHRGGIPSAGLEHFPLNSFVAKTAFQNALPRNILKRWWPGVGFEYLEQYPFGFIAQAKFRFRYSPLHPKSTPVFCTD